MNARHEQGFGSVDVAYADDDPAVHDELLDRQASTAGAFVKPVAIESIAQWLRSEMCQQFVAFTRGIHPEQRAEAPRVVEAHHRIACYQVEMVMRARQSTVRDDPE